ncbi:hypothetical protein EVAR_101740_1 [Eumeta japonica]|uniref:Uncharacterized protein n=1 Tax=Eumeta variegata TaxID=151549 RepID=A0A4C1SQ30_EUMVA|nr:hypothetical protein EVAR_101740_1 [Eumeta japonica]
MRGRTHTRFRLISVDPQLARRTVVFCGVCAAPTATSRQNRRRLALQDAIHVPGVEHEHIEFLARDRTEYTRIRQGSSTSREVLAAKLIKRQQLPATFIMFPKNVWILQILLSMLRSIPDSHGMAFRDLSRKVPGTRANFGSKLIIFCFSTAQYLPPVTARPRVKRMCAYATRIEAESVMLDWLRSDDEESNDRADRRFDDFEHREGKQIDPGCAITELLDMFNKNSQKYYVPGLAEQLNENNLKTRLYNTRLPRQLRGGNIRDHQSTPPAPIDENAQDGKLPRPKKILSYMSQPPEKYTMP